MARREDPKDQQLTNIKDWFTGEKGTQLPRRHEVWTLLGWYHQKVVEPQLGLRGLVMRWYWTLTHQTHRLSPWRELSQRIERNRARRELLQRMAEGERHAQGEGREAEVAELVAADNEAQPIRSKILSA